MITPTLPQIALGGIALGVLSHRAYFIHGEHHLQSFKYFIAALTFPTLAVVSLVSLSIPLLNAVKQTTVLYTAFFTGLYSSLFVYRVFLHPLRSFPGPFWAKVSKLWHAAQVVHTIDNFKHLDRMHAKYGTFVRTGPNEVSIIHPDVVEAAYGAASKCIKGAVYESNPALTSMHSTRSRRDHDVRRKAWSHGFTQNALREYEFRVDQYTKSLVHQIRAFAGQPLNAAQWFNYYSFDVMGDLAFAKSFDMLKNGQKHWAIEILNNGQRYYGILSGLPWLFGILSKIPRATSALNKFLGFCDDMMDERMNMKVDRPDISSWILQCPPMADKNYTERSWITGDSRLVIVAGSDTTAASLTHIFYHLSKDPHHVRILRDEIETLNGDFQASKLLTLKHLNGTVNEALRLHPPVPSGVTRITPPQGITIDGIYIPGNVNILAPLYTLSRSPECFASPDEFIPERWYSKPELVKRSDAFIPFLIGPYSCIGKQLALMEIRSVTAQLLQNFDPSFAPGENGTNLLEKTLDAFTMELAPLNLCFAPRKTGGTSA